MYVTIIRGGKAINLRVGSMGGTGESKEGAV